MPPSALTVEDLRLFLVCSSAFGNLVNEIGDAIKQDPARIFPVNHIRPFWCRYYEMPIREHIARAAASFGLLDELSKGRTTSEYINEAASWLDEAQNLSENALDGAAESRINSLENQNSIITALAHGTSLHRTFRCLEVYGHYLNDLITQVAAGGKLGDEALFCAVRIDPTVVGCSAVLGRISQAVMQSDEEFLHSLRNAMSGKLGRQDAEDARRRRLVFQILHEEGALKLTDDDLYELFVTELGIYDTHMKNGKEKSDAARSLQQMAYRFIKEKSST